MRINTALLYFCLIPVLVMAQSRENQITLQYCYNQINETYPSTKKAEIQEKITELNIRIARSGFYPDITLNASASYQSDVTEIPFTAPGTSPPVFSKDHYNISMDINQPIFNGGRTKYAQQLESQTGRAELAGIKAEILKIREQVEQVYFGILLLQSKKESIESFINELEEQLAAVQSKVDNGILLPGNVSVLEAELIKVKQQQIQVNYDITAGFEVLGILLGEEVETGTELKLPEVSITKTNLSENIWRAELEIFEAREVALQSQREIINANLFPVVSAFGKAAYGRPGLNAFDDDLQAYWIIGLRANWSFKNWSNSGKKAEIITLQQKEIHADEDAFIRQLKAQLNRIEQQAKMLREQIELDENVLELRAQVVQEKKNQLEQGVINSTEYITELNAENQAKFNLERRRIQLVQVLVNYSTKKGNSWN